MKAFGSTEAPYAFGAKFLFVADRSSLASGNIQTRSEQPQDGADNPLKPDGCQSFLPRRTFTNGQLKVIINPCF